MPNNPPRAKSKSKPRKRVRYRSADSLCNNSNWEKLSKLYRSKYPICQRCIVLGCVNVHSTRNLSVHHIKPRELYPDLIYDENNLLTLCNRCHHGHFSSLERSGRVDDSIHDGLNIKSHFDSN